MKKTLLYLAVFICMWFMFTRLYIILAIPAVLLYQKAEKESEAHTRDSR